MRRERRRGGSRERRAQVGASAINKMTQPLHKLPVYELLGEEALEQIHQVSMQILSEVGIAFYDEEALDILKRHGAEVDKEDVVRFDPALVEEYVAKAPSQFTQLAATLTIMW